MTQYESEARIPREDVVGQLAQTLDVSPLALKVPDIDSYLGLIPRCVPLKICTV